MAVFDGGLRGGPGGDRERGLGVGCREGKILGFGRGFGEGVDEHLGGGWSEDRSSGDWR